jgi:hypothetical protein
MRPDTASLQEGSGGSTWTLDPPPSEDYDPEPVYDPVQSERAARLMDLLGLSDEELCAALDVDPLSLLSGQLDHRPELSILLALLDEAAERTSPSALHRWVRASGPAGRPIDALVRRDFAAFEDAVDALAQRGFVIRGGGGRDG